MTQRAPLRVFPATTRYVFIAPIPSVFFAVHRSHLSVAVSLLGRYITEHISAVCCPDELRKCAQMCPCKDTLRTFGSRTLRYANSVTLRYSVAYFVFECSMHATRPETLSPNRLPTQHQVDSNSHLTGAHSKQFLGGGICVIWMSLVQSNGGFNLLHSAVWSCDVQF